MAELDMILTNSKQALMSYVPKDNKVTIYNNLSVLPTRTQKVYSDKMVVPLIYSIENTQGVELNFTREVREWDVVLPFGVDNKVPRRNPTEILYKGKKIKNSFM